MQADPQPYDHVRSEGTTLRDGTYRVVGVSDDDVTLLRVADDGGHRVHEGRVVSVTAEEYERLGPADNPDEPSLGTSVALTALGAGVLLLGMFSELLTTVAQAVGIGVVADILVFAGALAFAFGVRRLWSLRRF